MASALWQATETLFMTIRAEAVRATFVTQRLLPGKAQRQLLAHFAETTG